MDINRANMDSLFQSYNAAFHAGMQVSGQRPTPEDILLDDIAMHAPVSGAAVTHSWLNQIHPMRKWVGDRVINNLASGKLTIVNDDYENTVGVPRNDIEDDNYGLYTPVIGAMGTDSQALWMRLGIGALVANGLWADEKAFFATDRKYGEITINNLVTVALTPETFEAARIRMESTLLHGKEPAEVVADILVVGPKLRNTGWNIVKNEWVSAGTGKGGSQKNPNQNACRLGVSRRLVGDYADDWFLMGQMGGMKGIFVQKRKVPVLTRMDREEDESVFMRNEYRYGTAARGNGFLTFPHLIQAGLVSAA